MRRPFTVLVASDGSAHARTAVSLTVRFPWPKTPPVVDVVVDASPHRVLLESVADGLVAGLPLPVWIAT